MMSSAGTSRASRSSKDKTVKVQHNQNTSNVKATGDGAKNQPTAEQMRLAQMIQDKNDISDDPVLQAKVKQVMELTGRSSDDAIVALHDCDEDPNRAVNMLLEGEDQQGEWQESGKRKKGKTQPTPSKGDNLTNHTDSREKSRDRDREDFNTRDSGPPRDRRVRQPPRLARKNREREENERNSQRNRSSVDDEGEGRERSYERGRGRGRGQMNGGGGRGRGRGGRSYRSSRYDKGPQIETWTNETAENAEKENSTWEMSEDWTTDEWTGPLDETKVFTASSVAEPPSKGFSSTVGDNDAKMFTAPTMPVESQVFTSMTIENSSQSALNDTTNTLQNSIGQNSMGQNSHTLGQRLDLGLLLQKQPSETQPTTSQSQQSQFMSQFSKQATESLRNAMGVTSPSQQQSQFMTQFSKEATESIKNMMGIGTNSCTHQPTSVANQTVRPAIVSQSPPQQSQQQQQSQQVQQQLQQQQQALAQQRVRPQRSKLPPPSKIPASAVEMPGHISSFQLDVQFGNWDSGFSFGSPRNDPAASFSSSSPATSTTTTSAQGNHLQESKATTDTTSSPISPAMTVAISSTASSKPIMSSLDNMAPSQERSPRANVFQNATSPTTTPNKEYSQSRLDQSRKQMTPPDPIPFPSDRKSSPHYTSQRSGHPSSSISNSKSATSPSMTFSQSSYSSSSYPSSGYQSSAKSPTGTYNSHQSNSLSSSGNLSSGLQTHMSTSPSQYNHQSHSGYQTSSSFQSQNAFSNQGQTSLYQSNSQPSSYSSQSPTTYQSQNSSTYQSQSGPSSSSSSSYPNQSSTYHGRDNQSSSSSYQPSVSQSNSHYQSSGSQSSSTYQRDNQQSQSGYGSHQSYGSSSHQNSLPNSSMTISTSKLSDSLGKVSLKDSTLDSHTTSQNSYEPSSTTTTPSISTATTTSASLGGGSASVSSALGLTSATTATTSSSKSNLPVTSKAPPNLPPGVPLMGHNYMMQPGMPFAAFGLAQQPTMYSYEDLQLLQQRLPLPGYYDMPFQPPTTLTGRDQGTLANVPYTGADGKLGRVDAQSPVQAQTSQQGQNQSGHQQTYMNPTIPPGYNYYYPGAGMLPSGYSYTPPMFPVPSVTNAAHGGTTANAQFQKPGAYGSHAYNTAGAGYDDLNSQTQDYSKYGGASQSQSKGSAGGAVSSSTTEIAGSTYGKTHTQSFDKAGFHAATPPPFNLPLPTGTQAGPMAPTAAYGGPYVPVMPHQAHSQMLHPHLQQDSTGGSSRGSQQTSSQPKPGSNKPYGGYWSNN